MAKKKKSVPIRGYIYILIIILTFAALLLTFYRVSTKQAMLLPSKAYFGLSPTPYWFYCDRDGNETYSKTDSDDLTWCIFNHPYMHNNCPKTDLDRDDKYEFDDQQHQAECYYYGMNANEYCANGDYNGNSIIDKTEWEDTYRCISGVFGYPPMGGVAGGSFKRGSKLVRCATDPERWPSPTPPQINAGDLSHCQYYFYPMPTYTIPTPGYGMKRILVKINCNACDFDFNRQICSDEINKISNDCIFGNNFHSCYLNGDENNIKLKGDCNRDGKIDAGDMSCCANCAGVSGNKCRITPTP